MSNFEFLTAEWKDLHEAARKAEQTAIPDPRTSCFDARHARDMACLPRLSDSVPLAEKLTRSAKNGVFRRPPVNCRLDIYVKLYT